jgi:hypothetical protein
VWAAVATALILTSAVMLATAVLSIDTDTRLGHHRRLRARNAEALAEMGSEPGILFLEIDGLAYPELLPALLAHPGIGFVLVRTEDDGAVVLGAAGSRWLADGRVEGEDPPAPFGRNASHGGMGGPQSYPFVLAPAGLEPHGEVVGAEGVHRVFRRWLTALGHTGYAAP